MSEVVLTSREGGIVTVSLNRPERMNALNKAVWQALGDVFLDLAKDESVRCVVLRGQGAKAFAPGADIEEFDTDRADAAQAEAYDLLMRRALAAVRECPHPTIALIFGPCVGGGLELACQCDLRIAGEGARFGVPINRIGVVMAYPEIEGILRLIGPARTAEILLEGRVLPAAEALRMGLLNRVTADVDLEGEVFATALRIANGAPLVNRWHKRFIRRLVEDQSPISREESAECYRFLETADYREGIAAFKAKRTPEFSGK
jgi:enoyl-CoA hydratase